MSAQCSARACDQTAICRGRCRKHYQRWRRRHLPQIECSKDGCDRPRNARGLCSTHYARAKKTGTMPPRRERQTHMIEARYPGAAWVVLPGSAGGQDFCSGLAWGLELAGDPRELPTEPRKFPRET